jgi:hypothetical protein
VETVYVAAAARNKTIMFSKQKKGTEVNILGSRNVKTTQLIKFRFETLNSEKKVEIDNIFPVNSG